VPSSIIYMQNTSKCRRYPASTSNPGNMVTQHSSLVLNSHQFSSMKFFSACSPNNPSRSRLFSRSQLPSNQIRPNVLHSSLCTGSCRSNSIGYATPKTKSNALCKCPIPALQPPYLPIGRFRKKRGHDIVEPGTEIIYSAAATARAIVCQYQNPFSHLD
jgi:hypothetical protein